MDFKGEEAEEARIWGTGFVSSIWQRWTSTRWGSRRFKENVTPTGQNVEEFYIGAGLLFGQRLPPFIAIKGARFIPPENEFWKELKMAIYF